MRAASAGNILRMCAARTATNAAHQPENGIARRHGPSDGTRYSSRWRRRRTTLSRRALLPSKHTPRQKPNVITHLIHGGRRSMLPAPHHSAAPGRRCGAHRAPRTPQRKTGHLQTLSTEPAWRQRRLDMDSIFMAWRRSVAYMAWTLTYVALARLDHKAP